MQHRKAVLECTREMKAESNRPLLTSAEQAAIDKHSDPSWPFIFSMAAMYQRKPWDLNLFNHIRTIYTNLII